MISSHILVAVAVSSTVGHWPVDTLKHMAKDNSNCWLAILIRDRQLTDKKIKLTLNEKLTMIDDLAAQKNRIVSDIANLVCEDIATRRRHLLLLQREMTECMRQEALITRQPFVPPVFAPPSPLLYPIPPDDE